MANRNATSLVEVAKNTSSLSSTDFYSIEVGPSTVGNLTSIQTRHPPFGRFQMLHDIGQESAIPDIVGVGNLASQIHIPVTELVRVAAELAIEPSARINGIPHYPAAAAARIAAHVRQMDQHRT